MYLGKNMVSDTFETTQLLVCLNKRITVLFGAAMCPRKTLDLPDSLADKADCGTPFGLQGFRGGN